MKRLLILLAVLLAPSLAEAQLDDAPYCGDPNVAQTKVVRDWVLAENRRTCRRLNVGGAAGACTQAQACTAPGCAAPGGASCTFGQAFGAGCAIYSDDHAGRQLYVLFVWLLPDFLTAENAAPALIRQDSCFWWNNTANQTQKDAECAKWGAPAGCIQWPAGNCQQ